MNYSEYKKYYKMTTKYNFGNIFYYDYFNNLTKDFKENPNNEKVYRCDIAKLWDYKFPIFSKGRFDTIGINGGVRNSLRMLMKSDHLKNLRWYIPRDVYPVYVKYANQLISFSGYNTLIDNYHIFQDKEIFLDNTDVVLITSPLKPKGDDISNDDRDILTKWLRKDPKRRLIIDAVYSRKDGDLGNHWKNLYEEGQVYILRSFSKLYAIPDIGGAINIALNDLDIFNKNDNQERSYQMMKECLEGSTTTDYIKNTIRIKLNNNMLRINEILREYKIDVGFGDTSIDYLRWSSYNPDFFNKMGIIVVPASVYGGESGSIISSLI